jgi:Skp family chaperone for outer membrane proteins
MINFKHSLISIFFFVFFLTPVLSNEKIVFIDINYVINESIYGKSILENLNNIYEKNNKKIETKKKNIQDQDNEIKKTSNIISKEELDKKIRLLKEEIKNFRVIQKELDANFKKNKNEQINAFMIKINPLIEKYMEDKSIDIMMRREDIFIAKKSINVSDDIIILIDKNIK